MAAVRNAGFEWPRRRVTVNLAPADVRKEGSAFDLPIAIGIVFTLKSPEGFKEYSQYLRNFLTQAIHPGTPYIILYPKGTEVIVHDVEFGGNRALGTISVQFTVKADLYAPEEKAQIHLHFLDGASVEDVEATFTLGFASIP